MAWFNIWERRNFLPAVIVSTYPSSFLPAEKVADRNLEELLTSKADPYFPPGLMAPAQKRIYSLCCAEQTVCIYRLWKHCLLLSILPGGRANTCTHRKILSVECLSRANSWPLSSCAFPAGSCPAGSLSSWSIPAVVYEPANDHRNAACLQHLPEGRAHTYRHREI
jgi:hypothetical protein